VLGHDVHAPDVRDMPLLNGALAMTARDADQAVALERAEETIEIGPRVHSQALGPYLD
jgi:hypothetical protein